ncbi:MAG: hypothetical protein HYR93_07075, partial [Chloroflexi bacterium]|nr:hypothetical protein [Chloroflexota bacterium]
MPAATQKKASKPKTKTAAARKTAKTKPVAEETQQELIAEEVEVSPALPPAPVAKLKKTERPSSNAIRPIREQFDLNLIVLAGRVRSVWGNKTDVFARLSVSHRGRLIEDDDALSSY